MLTSNRKKIQARNAKSTVKEPFSEECVYTDKAREGVSKCGKREIISAGRTTGDVKSKV